MHITGSHVALTVAIYNIKIRFLYNSKNLIGRAINLAINLNAPSKLQKLIACIIRFMDKSHTNGKLFNMVTLSLVSKDGKELGLVNFID